MNPPTAIDIRNWTQLNLARYGYADDAKLQPVVDRAIGYILVMTGQTLPDLDPSASPTASAAHLEPLMQQAIQMRVEQVLLQGRPGHVNSAADNEVVQSFSAGSYSESRRAGQGFSSRTGAAERGINTWPALEELLWMLMTPERFAYWWAFTSGQPMPDFTVEEVNWRGAASAITFFEPWDRWVPAGYGDGLM
jgi:hypothetical protein